MHNFALGQNSCVKLRDIIIDQRTKKTVYEGSYHADGACVENEAGDPGLDVSVHLGCSVLDPLTRINSFDFLSCFVRESVIWAATCEIFSTAKGLTLRLGDSGKSVDARRGGMTRRRRVLKDGKVSSLDDDEQRIEIT